MGAEIVVAVSEEPARQVVLATPRGVDAQAWEFSVWRDLGDGEPRIRDLDAAVRLGFARPRKIRDLIARIWPEDQRPINRPTVGRWIAGKGAQRERVVNEYWLTEAQLLKVCARAATPIADAVLDDMIAVYLATRRHLAGPLALPAPVPPPPAPAALPGDADPALALRAVTLRVPGAVVAFYAARVQRLGLPAGYGPEFAMRQVLLGAVELAHGLGVA